MTSAQSVKHLRIYLLRHGKAEGMEEGRLFGRKDVALSELGLDQARLLTEKLSSVKLAAIYSSDLGRTIQTAQAIAKNQNLEVQPLAAWREIDMGDWEGCLLSDLFKNERERVAALFADPASFCYPNGESFQSFTERVQRQLNVLLAMHQEGAIALVTHAGVIRTIVGTVLEIPMRRWLSIAQGYGALNIIDWHDNVASLQLLNG